MSKSGVAGFLSDNKGRNQSAKAEKDRQDAEKLKAADKARAAERRQWDGKNR
jgi:hypothetical protein